MRLDSSVYGLRISGWIEEWLCLIALGHIQRWRRGWARN